MFVAFLYFLSICRLLVHLNIVCVLFQIDRKSIGNQRFCNFWALSSCHGDRAGKHFSPGQCLLIVKMKLFSEHTL